MASIALAAYREPKSIMNLRSATWANTWTTEPGFGQAETADYQIDGSASGYHPFTANETYLVLAKGLLGADLAGIPASMAIYYDGTELKGSRFLRSRSAAFRENTYFYAGLFDAGATPGTLAPYGNSTSASQDSILYDFKMYVLALENMVEGTDYFVIEDDDSAAPTTLTGSDTEDSFASGNITVDGDYVIFANIECRRTTAHAGYISHILHVGGVEVQKERVNSLSYAADDFNPQTTFVYPVTISGSTAVTLKAADSASADMDAHYYSRIIAVRLDHLTGGDHFIETPADKTGVGATHVSFGDITPTTPGSIWLGIGTTTHVGGGVESATPVLQRGWVSGYDRSKTTFPMLSNSGQTDDCTSGQARHVMHDMRLEHTSTLELTCSTESGTANYEDIGLVAIPLRDNGVRFVENYQTFDQDAGTGHSGYLRNADTTPTWVDNVNAYAGHSAASNQLWGFWYFETIQLDPNVTVDSAIVRVQKYGASTGTPLDPTLDIALDRVATPTAPTDVNGATYGTNGVVIDLDVEWDVLNAGDRLDVDMTTAFNEAMADASRTTSSDGLLVVLKGQDTAGSDFLAPAASVSSSGSWLGTQLVIDGRTSNPAPAAGGGGAVKFFEAYESGIGWRKLDPEELKKRGLPVPYGAS